MAASVFHCNEHDIPNERDSTLRSMIATQWQMLEKILANAERSNRKLGKLHHDLGLLGLGCCDDEETMNGGCKDDGVAAISCRLEADTTPVHHAPSQQISAMPSATQSQAAAGSPYSSRKDKSDVAAATHAITATWVNFVDGGKRAATDSWSKTLSEDAPKAQKEKDTDKLVIQLPKRFASGFGVRTLQRSLSTVSDGSGADRVEARVVPQARDSGEQENSGDAEADAEGPGVAGNGRGGGQAPAAEAMHPRRRSGSLHSLQGHVPSKLFKAIEKITGLAADDDLAEHPEDAPPQSGLEISKSALNTASCILILLHMMYIGLQVELGIRSAKTGSTEPQFLVVADLVFACFFTLELLLRCAMEGKEFFFGKHRLWNLFDALLLVVQGADIIFAFFQLGWLRVVRVLRVMRAARALRTVRHFTELRLMVMSIISTLASLFWAFVLLLLVLYLVALGITQIVEHHVRQDEELLDADPQLKMDMFEMYGSVGDSILTLFKSISGGADWQELVYPLVAMNKAYVLIYVVYISFMVFGVTNVLTAIFVESASQVASIDQDLAIQDQLRRDKSTINRIKTMFIEADKDGSGLITLGELERLLDDPKYIWAMRLIGVDVSESKGLFRLLDVNEMEAVNIDEFVTGMMRLKGGAKGVDLATLIYDHKRMYSSLQAGLDAISARLVDFHANFVQPMNAPNGFKRAGYESRSSDGRSPRQVRFERPPAQGDPVAEPAAAEGGVVL